MATGTIHSVNPLLAVYEDVARADEIAHCLSLGTGMARDRVAGLGGSEVSERRTNSVKLLDQWADPVLAGLVERLSDIVRLPPENTEPAKLLHYEGTQSFDTHVDAFSALLPGQALEFLNGGQRLFTTLLYLNDAEGGETVYPKLKLSVAARAGRVLVGGHTIPGTTDPHPHSVHAGTSVTSGDKWVLSLRWRERAYVKLRDYPEAEGEMKTI